MSTSTGDDLASGDGNVEVAKDRVSIQNRIIAGMCHDDPDLPTALQLLEEMQQTLSCAETSRILEYGAPRH